MYDKAKADILGYVSDMQDRLNQIEDVLADKTAVLSNKTRLAVLEECHQAAKKHLAAAQYDLAQTKSYGQPDNFSPADIVDLDNNIVHLECLVTSARFAVNHEK